MLAPLTLLTLLLIAPAAEPTSEPVDLFVRDLLEQVGVVPLIHRHGAYKSMGDMFNRQSMSEAHREMSEELAQDLYAQISAPVAVALSMESPSDWSSPLAVNPLAASKVSPSKTMSQS